MCLCSAMVWEKISYLFCCCGYFRGQAVKRKKDKRKKTKKTDNKSMDSSKGTHRTQTPIRETPVAIRNTVSELNETEFWEQYMIVLPKDNCTEADQWLYSKGYQINENVCLGKGGFGVVYKAVKTESDGSKVDIAAKVLDLKPQSSKHSKLMGILKNELFVADALITQIKRVKHNHIISIFDMYIIQSKDQKTDKPLCKAYLFMELAEGNLNQELEKSGPLVESVAKRYFAQIVYAIHYMHSLHIAHRDIKLENFLLVKSISVPDAMDIKVSDFGLSRVHYKDGAYIHSHRTGGTRWYKAPEILKIRARMSNKEYDVYKTDIWALGISLYKMLTNKYPFPSPEIDLTQVIALQEKKAIDLDKIKNKSAKDLILYLLEPEPNKRIKIDDIKAHKWLEGETTITMTQSNA